MNSVEVNSFLSWSWAQLCSLALISLGVLVLGYEVARWWARIPGFRGPYGPPIVGNMWQIYGKDAPLQYRHWSQKYGAVYQVQLGHIPILVINTAAAAKAILTHNSSATASRPEFYTFHKIISRGAALTIGSSPYSESLKRRRKVFASALNKPSVASYVPHINNETKIFLKEALVSGRAGKENINPIPLFLRMNVSLGFTLHWGSRVETQTSLFREIVYVENEISNFRSTTSNPQDYIPLLRLNPFSGVSATARDMSIRRNHYMSIMDQGLDKRLADGSYKPCIRANVKLDPDGKLNEAELSSLNVTMTAAGLDTMQSTVSWGLAILAMMPDVQDKALKEIRKKYPQSQPLCDETDDLSIEYVMCMIKEIVRHYPATRLSLPRRTLQDISYENRIIPKGTILFLNAWACNMDPAIWTDPEVFRPERWLDQREAPIFTFGLGSRMCIGIHMAYRELYMLFIRLINSYEIVADVPIDIDPITGVANPMATVSMPMPFEVRFEPRDVGVLKKALDVADIAIEWAQHRFRA